MEKETEVLRTERTKEKNKEIMTTGRKKTKPGLVHCCRKKGRTLVAPLSSASFWHTDRHTITHTPRQLAHVAVGDSLTHSLTHSALFHSVANVVPLEMQPATLFHILVAL